MSRTLDWNVTVHLEEEDGTTRAQAVLDTGTVTLTGQGVARCNPEDLDVAAIGDDLAAGRAVKNIADQLMREADRELEAMGAGRVVEPAAPPFGWSDT
ncbi:dsRBD fold-containing protein [Streptomyces sp. NPDC051907]|uniref:dsRBD fold-containing protein n=1 Tax=Streptomyces sp. NPDC051907 TaxID=3155284 RepID=UPI003414B04C